MFHQLPDIAVAAPSQHRRQPQSGPYLDGSEHPSHALLAVDEGAYLIGLQLVEHVSPQHPGAEAFSGFCCPFKPSIDGIPRQMHGACDG